MTSIFNNNYLLFDSLFLNSLTYLFYLILFFFFLDLFFTPLFVSSCPCMVLVCVNASCFVAPGGMNKIA